MKNMQYWKIWHCLKIRKCKALIKNPKQTLCNSWVTHSSYLAGFGMHVLEIARQIYIHLESWPWPDFSINISQMTCRAIMTSITQRMKKKVKHVSGQKLSTRIDNETKICLWVESLLLSGVSFIFVDTFNFCLLKTYKISSLLSICAVVNTSIYHGLILQNTVVIFNTI